MKHAGIAYSRGCAKHDASPEQRHARTFHEFQEAILSDRAQRKGEAYICAPCRPNGDGRAHRDKASVLPSTFLVLDLDELTYDSALLARKAFAQFECFAYETPSSTRDKPRMRAVIATDRAMTRDEQLHVGAQIQTLFRDKCGIDLDANQFRPEQCADVPVGEAKAWRYKGKPLGVDVFLAAPPPGQTAPDTRTPGKIKSKRHDFLLSQLSDLRRLPPHLRKATIHGINAELCDPPLPRAEVEALADWAADATEEWRPHLDLTKLALTEPLRPQFIAPGVLTGYACGLYGHGGAGKSYIGLMLAVCIATGTPFCGMPVERRRVGWFSEEDRASVLHARLSHICKYLKISMAALDGRLFAYDLVGQDTILYQPNTRGADPRTIVYSMAKERVREHGLEVLFFDGLAGFFGGNENVRPESKGFVSMVVGLIPPERGAVVVLGHIDKASARNDAKRDAYSGSTGWWNAFRTLLLLYYETDGSQRKRLILELQKSNHGTVGTQFEFRWDDAAQMFVGAAITPTTPTERVQQEHSEREALLSVIRKCMAQGVVIPSARSGPRSAYIVMSEHPAFPEALKTGKAGGKRFWAHIEALRHSGDVFDGVHVKPNRHRIEQLLARDATDPKERKF
ncbi:MAG: AAA family ATPase [Usitatibacter sp.]